MRKLVVSFNVPSYWERWSIRILDENAPDAITESWLQDNPERWDWVEQIEFGSAEPIFDLNVEKEVE